MVVFWDGNGGFSWEGAVEVFFVEVVVAVFEGVDFVGGDVFADVDFAFDGDFFYEVFVFVDDDVHVVVAEVVVVVDVDFQVRVVARVWVHDVCFLRFGIRRFVWDQFVRNFVRRFVSRVVQVYVRRHDV